MCVIIHARKHRPDLETLKKCEDQNSHGGGIAWFEHDERYGGQKVVWAKGLDADEIYALAKTKPLPYVIHFRIATVGGQSKMLTHPFAISHKSELFLNGQARAVLFHNGHVRDLDMTAKVLQLPRMLGEESDSRQIAQICSKAGHDWLKEIAGYNRFAVMQDGNITTYGTWTKVRGIWYSNDYWNKSSSTTTSGPYSHGKYRRGYSNGSCGIGDEYWDHFPNHRREVSTPATTGSTNPPTGLVSTSNTNGKEKDSTDSSNTPTAVGSGLALREPTNDGYAGHRKGCTCPLCTSVHRERIEEAAKTHPVDCNCNLCMEVWKENVRKGQVHEDDCNCQKCIDTRWEEIQKRSYQKLPGVPHYRNCRCTDCLKACHGAAIKHKESCPCDRCAKVREAVESHGLLCDCPTCRVFAAARYFQHGTGCRCWFCRKSKSFLDRGTLLGFAALADETTEEKPQTTTTETPAPVTAPETGSTPIPVTIVPANEDASGK